MEFVILAGLALFILFAATAESGEPEVETIVITRSASERPRRIFPSLIFVLMLILLTVMVAGRLAAIAG